jgi:hypothetical protein
MTDYAPGYLVEYPDGHRETVTDGERGMLPLKVGDRIPWRLSPNGTPLWLTVIAVAR